MLRLDIIGKRLSHDSNYRKEKALSWPCFYRFFKTKKRERLFFIAVYCRFLSISIVMAKPIAIARIIPATAGTK